MKKFIMALVLVVGSFVVPTLSQAASPVQNCRHSLNVAYAEIPYSMLGLCNYANHYSARAVDTYTKRYTSLPLDVMQILMAVKTSKQLQCVESVAQNYSSVTQYFISRVCFDGVYLNY